jgi:hypothetical protein
LMLLAGRTSRDNYTLTALRCGRRLIHETTEVVSADFCCSARSKTDFCMILSSVKRKRGAQDSMKVCDDES